MVGRTGNRPGLLPDEPAGAGKPGINEGLPPGETRTKLRRTASRAPHANWIGDPPMIQSQHPTLEPLEPNANHKLPMPGDPLYFIYFFHRFSVERNK